MPSNSAESHNSLTSKIIAAAIEVHRRLGPGLLESAYEACLAYEIRKRGFKALCQVSLPVVYDELELDVGYRIDVLVDDQVIIELKAVKSILGEHVAQLLGYLRSSRVEHGVLMNLGASRFFIKKYVMSEDAHTADIP